MLQDVLAIGSGSLVGFVLGLIGGGGSILAVPLLVYVVGVSSPHIAIGTSAVAVALSALSSLVGHARAGNVRWPCASAFAVAGVGGAAFGSTIGKHVDGQQLLTLFGVLMIVVAVTFMALLVSAALRATPGVLMLPLQQKLWLIGCNTPTRPMCAFRKSGCG